MREKSIEIIRNILLIIATLLIFSFILAIASAQQSYVVNINEGLGVSTGDDKNKKNSAPNHYKINIYEKIKIFENNTIDSKSVVRANEEVKVNESAEKEFKTDRIILATWVKVLIWIAIALIVLFVIYFIWTNWNIMD